MADRGQPHQIAGQVLIIIAVDIVRVRTSGGRMADRDTGYHSDEVALLLGLVSDGLYGDAGRIHIHSVVIGLDPSCHAARGAGGVGVGMHRRGRLVPRGRVLVVRGHRPRSASGQCGCVPAANRATGIDDGLRIDVDLGALVVRTGHHKAELCPGARSVILEMKSGSSPIGVLHFTSLINRRSPSRLPIHPIEHHQKDMLATGDERGLLDGVEIRLIHPVGGQIERPLGRITIEGQHLGGIAVRALLSRVILQINPRSSPLRPERVNRNQPIRVRTPLHVIRRGQAPMTERGTARLHS